MTKNGLFGSVHRVNADWDQFRPPLTMQACMVKKLYYMFNQEMAPWLGGPWKWFKQK